MLSDSFSIPLGILIVFLGGCLCQQDKDADHILRNITATRFSKGKELQFRSGADAPSHGYSKDTRVIPTEAEFFQQDYFPLECGENYLIAQEGHVYFDLGPGPQPCYFGFLGSKMDHCTVGVYCPGIISLAPESPFTKRCEEEYLVLTDGTGGVMSGCDVFSFRNKPRYPRNGGTDLFVHVKGHASNVRCIALCIEDLKPGLYGLGPPMPISGKSKLVTRRAQNLKRTESQCKCGIRKDGGRIVGGENAFKYEFPWIAALVYPGSRRPFCGGSLINDRYILSAGHCFASGKISTHNVEVLLHAHLLDQNPFRRWTDPKLKKVPGWDLPKETDESEDSLRLRVSEIRVHPMFNLETFDFDFAILKLAKPLKLVGATVSPICLPSMNKKIVYEDETIMTVAGWGVPWESGPATSRLLQKLDVPFVNRETCREYTVPTDRHVCAGYLEGGKDACSGDSGGPLIYKFNPDGNQYLLSGVVSAGAGCARSSELGLYSDVQEGVQWVYRVTSDATWCSQ